MRRHAWLLCAAPALGFTECEYFTTVTVPNYDFDEPGAWGRVYVGGLEHLLVEGQDLALPSPTQTFTVYPAAMDDGGVASLEVAEWVEATCSHAGTTLHRTTWLPEQFDWQPGGVGSVVSNGLWLGSSVNTLEPYLGLCDAGFALRRIEYGFVVLAEDFHGNYVDSLPITLSYAF